MYVYVVTAMFCKRLRAILIDWALHKYSYYYYTDNFYCVKMLRKPELSDMSKHKTFGSAKSSYKKKVANRRMNTLRRISQVTNIEGEMTKYH